MASSIELFHSAKQYLWDGTIDLDTNTIKLALVTSAYTKDLTDTVWGDISAAEVASGSGYTTDGATLSGSDVTYSTTTTTWDATNVTFSNLTKSFRFGVLYVDGVVNSVDSPLIAIILFDTTPADISVSATDFVVAWSASGIMAY